MARRPRIAERVRREDQERLLRHREDRGDRSMANTMSATDSTSTMSSRGGHARGGGAADGELWRQVVGWWG